MNRPKINVLYLNYVPELAMTADFFKTGNNYQVHYLDSNEISLRNILFTEYRVHVIICKAANDLVYEILDKINKSGDCTPTIVVLPSSSCKDVVQLMKSGAFHVIEASGEWKEQLKQGISDALEYSAIHLEKNTDRNQALAGQMYQMLEKFPLGYQSLDRKGRFLFVNDEWSKILGYTKEEVLGQRFEKFMPVEDAEAFHERFSNFVRNGYANATVRLYDKGNNLKYIHFNAHIGYKDNGVFDRTHCIILDMTEKVELENQLLESEEKYRLLMDTSIDAVLVTNPDGSIYEANQSACDMFGWTEQEICEGGRNLLVDTNDPRLYEQLQKRAENGRSSGIITFKRKDNSKFEGDITSAVFTTSQGKTFSSIVVRDITEKIETLNRSIESEKKYRLLIENHSELVINMDHQGSILFASPSFCKFTGKEEKELVGNSFLFFIAREDIPIGKDMMTQIAKMPHNYSIDLRMESATGNQWVAWNINSKLDESGQTLESLCIGRNINEQKIAQRKIEEQLKELTRWHETTLGREFRIVELKREVNRLLSEAGKPPLYTSVENDTEQ